LTLKTILIIVETKSALSLVLPLRPANAPQVRALSGAISVRTGKDTKEVFICLRRKMR
jgi:hypothetical protein